MSWIQDRWHELVTAGSTTWLALGTWAVLAVGVFALFWANRQVRRDRELSVEETRPHVGMFMEPHAADWHVMELVVRNFGRTAAYNIRFAFPHPPTVAAYENTSDGYADVVELHLPDELATLAPNQEWRTVWDSAIERAELGDDIESRFTGTVTYYDRPDARPRWKFWRPARRQFETQVVLDWGALPPVQRVELMSTHDLAKREKQKLELLRGVLRYFHYASTEPRPDVFRSEIERINRAADENQRRWRARQQLDDPTDVHLRWGQPEQAVGKHRV
ncbi:hypothetical protein [Mycobacterium celatum]|uniref:Uncharacterized protein n=1 Tax=Mycobacterium celatum TaxID=28045 RepID=A0A1X1RSP8_MYCCE|nr:hypothetical protein [Mycobacterium celatum]ORV14852.1 hypothetical protein AWB95_09615 [Mycobacterium celatum]PIB80104.1 hypothetical protein CQY23_05655 [Mycobacterium celatum]